MLSNNLKRKAQACTLEKRSAKCARTSSFFEWKLWWVIILYCALLYQYLNTLRICKILSDHRSFKIYIKMFLFEYHRLIANYRFTEGALTRPSEILRHSNEDKENAGGEPLTARTLGRIIKEVFDGRREAKLVATGPEVNRYRAYMNVERMQCTFADLKSEPQDVDGYCF